MALDGSFSRSPAVAALLAFGGLAAWPAVQAQGLGMGLMRVSAQTPEAASTSHALPSASCDIGAVQQLLGQQPRPAAEVDQALDACERAAPQDWRVHWLRGVVARDAGRLNDAVAALGRAREIAPAEAAPALDLAVTHEWLNDPDAARAVYEGVLGRDPGSRPALLGKARVARAQGRLEEARGIYSQIIVSSPQDLEATNGLAWLDLADLRVDVARARFDKVIAADPGNAEAKQGLQRLAETWRYRLDAGVGTANLAAGTSRTGYLGLLVNLNASDQVEVALGRNTRELPSERLADPTPLPSWTGRVGYRSRFDNGPGWSAAYEYRERSATSPEHRVEVGLDGRFPGVADRVQWFVGLRQSFSTPSDNRLARAGLSVAFAPHWSVAGTFYAGRDKLSGSSSAVALDLYREVGAMGSLFNIGIGHSPDPDNISLHARLVYPVAQMQALVVGVERRSLGNEVEATVGWRVYWQ